MSDSDSTPDSQPADSQPADTQPADRLRRALASPSSSDRLQAALSAGTYPDPSYIDVLIDRCRVESDFFVRDMLTWSLTRHPAAETVARLIAETKAGAPQARSQALHTLSKIGDPRGWEAITEQLLRDPDDAVARTAWRTAAILVPAGREPALASALTTQLARGEYETRVSLSRAFSRLGASAEPALTAAGESGEVGARIHAVACLRLIDDPDEGFDAAIFEAERIVILG